jgi:hypothetical protein
LGQAHAGKAVTHNCRPDIEWGTAKPLFLALLIPALMRSMIGDRSSSAIEPTVVRNTRAKRRDLTQAPPEPLLLTDFVFDDQYFHFPLH